ncbi:response regulator [Paenibacillus hamazuiensis]|uniref:response regulator n=1 Tax=Paenibacillus hamazuiensis TaxID=2936508 RepID=UPI00200DA57C|nr:response regulator [Paenibacillus hamazuiensis]
MLRAILVDDEQPALDLLEKLLSASGHIGISGMFTKPDEAVKWLKRETVDIVFLDIDMPGMNGIEAAEHMTAIDPGIEIVFVTAYNQYAIDAFEINAVDYVLKPITAGRLGKTVERIVSRRGTPAGGEYTSAVPAVKSHFRCFRRFEWICDPDSSAAVKWRTSKERELMAYLVHHRNTFVAKEKILEDVWDSSNTEQAAVFLHTCIYGIRKRLGGIGCKHLLEFKNNSYRLETRGLLCDADEFERIAGGGGSVSPVSIGEFERVATLYTGDYMEEDGFVWAYEAQVRFKDAYIGLMKRMAECYLSMKAPRAAADCLRSALEKNPFLDDVNETLLKVYADMGDRLSMVRHYNHFTKLLQEELGIAPLKSTVQLYTRLCSGSADEES